MDKKHCLGCEQDFYNGKNQYNVKECWSFKVAKVIFRKEVPVWQEPPWNQKAIRKPNCYRRKGYVYIDPKRKF